jgi:hypothetical protein
MESVLEIGQGLTRITDIPDYSEKLKKYDIPFEQWLTETWKGRVEVECDMVIEEPDPTPESAPHGQ